jgi:hypothetical protein
MDWQTFMLGLMSALFPSLCILAWLLVLYRDVKKMVQVGPTVLASFILSAASPPLPQIKRGQCPPSYTSSGGYCIPKNERAPMAIPKGEGSCPAGYASSAHYCEKMDRR